MNSAILRVIMIQHCKENSMEDKQGNWKYDYDAIAVMMDREHRGKDNTITSREIAEYLGIDNRPNFDVQIKNIMNRVMKHKQIPIISNRFGYFIPENDDEMNEYIVNMRGRMKGIEERLALATRLYYKE